MARLSPPTKAPQKAAAKVNETPLGAAGANQMANAEITAAQAHTMSYAMTPHEKAAATPHEEPSLD